MTELCLERLPTPLGVLLFAADERGRVHALEWEDHAERLQRSLRLYHRVDAAGLPAPSRRSAAGARLSAYFAGDLAAIDAIPVETGGSPFQRQVWSALRRIPVGETLSYGALAARIGRPQAVRAVGAANGANPVSIVVPCHRVIGADASLTGYGGGLERKRWLLCHEGVRLLS